MSNVHIVQVPMQVRYQTPYFFILLIYLCDNYHVDLWQLMSIIGWLCRKVQAMLQSYYQDSLDHCPMPINDDQTCVIDLNADQCRSMPDLLHLVSAWLTWLRLIGIDWYLLWDTAHINRYYPYFTDVLIWPWLKLRGMPALIGIGH